MRAAVVGPHPTTAPVSVREVPVPDVPRTWVLVQLHAAALNRHDAMMVADRHTLERPTVFGADGAGIVVGVGAQVTSVAVGDEVVISPSLWWGDDPAAPSAYYEILGSPTDGTHAEYVAVPAENVLPKPARLTWSQAAALPLAGVTAWRALVSRGRLTAGETVVVAAASSGVGSLAVRIAHGLGARVVAISSSPDKLDDAIAAGADQALLRTGPAFAEELARATGGRADLALDPTGALWGPLLGALRPGGRLVTVGRMASDTATVPVRTVFWKQVDILGSSMGSPADFAAFMDHVAHARWLPAIDASYSLDEVADAYERLDAPDRLGKVVLDLMADRRGTVHGQPASLRSSTTH